MTVKGCRGLDIMNEPKISIIIPVYGVEKYIRKCLDSVVAQSYRNLEIIVVDDGSPDDCGAICDEYAARDERICVIHKQNGGVSSARNAGLAVAGGEWIGWVDSDDWIEPDMYEYLLSNVLEYGADICVCGRQEVYPNRIVNRGWEQRRILDTEEALALLLANDIMQNYLWDKLWRRQLFDGISFPEGRTYEDIAVMHQLFERAACVLCLPESKYNYFQRSGSIVDDISLGNRINHYVAAMQRYENMRERWPQFCPQLESQCVASAIGIWCSCFRNKRKIRKMYWQEIKKIAAFSKLHYKSAVQHLGLGLAGKVVVPLTQYTAWWAFAIASVISRLYKLKNGRAL